MNANSTWKTGDKVSGSYCGVAYSGSLNKECRPTPDWKNIIFCISLDAPITVYGLTRDCIEVWTNGKDSIIAS